MANAKWVPDGAPPRLEPFDGPANSWIPTQETQKPVTENPVMQVDIERCDAKSVCALMGKAWRNPVTGEVQMKQFGTFQDFQIADLWTRDYLSGTAEQLAKDPYIFRPIPMLSRTWMYHHLARSGKVFQDQSGAEEDAMIRFILSQHCIDTPVLGGKWASSMLHVPMILFLTLAADMSATVVAIAIFTLSMAIIFLMNTPELYRWSRLVTFPLRLVLLIWIIHRMGAKGSDTKEGQSATSTLGFVIALGMCILEIILGDGGALCAYRLHCSYEVITTLPNRLFVCRRKGAYGLENSSIAVSEKITGMGGWREDNALIADVNGLIVELEPMGAEDWKLCFLEKQANDKCAHRFIGLDVYSPGAATIDALSAAIDEQQKIMARSLKVEEA